MITDLVVRTSRERPGIRVHVKYVRGLSIAGCKHCYEEGDYQDARNKIAEKAVEMGTTHVLMIDSDMDFGRDTDNTLLLKLLDHECDIIAPLFIRRSIPFDFCAFHAGRDGLKPISRDECRAKKLTEVDALGMGMILIETHVLKQMSFPWFYFQWH